jgi:hypothetical protein
MAVISGYKATRPTDLSVRILPFLCAECRRRPGTPVQLKLSGAFRTFPFGFIAVARERFVRAWITQTQTGLTDAFAAVDFFLR